MKTLCDISSLRYWRVPPLIRAHLDPALDVALGPGRYSFAPAVQALGLSDQPLCLLVNARSARAFSTNVRTHLLSIGPPLGSVCEIGAYASVASPALTLFTLAPRLSLNHLVMLMHEMCGAFAVYRPTEQERVYLQGLIDQHALPIVEGWKPVLDVSGRLTDLWKRPPLVTLAELEVLGWHMAGAHGNKKFNRAYRCTHEGAASPFEVRGGMRFGMSRRLGGEGIEDLTYNFRVALSPDARRISRQAVAYVDILLRDASSGLEVGVECQSHLIHDRLGMGVADGDRATALMSMGYVMVQLSHENLTDPQAFSSVCDYVFRRLGKKRVTKSAGLRRREAELCRDLYVDWGSIGLYRGRW